MIKELARKNILKLKPYTSARDSHLTGILLDANENSIYDVDTERKGLNRYPDPRQNKLRKRVSEITGVPEANLFFGVGSDEIIDLLVRIFCVPGIDKAVITEPTYGMYQVVCNINDIGITNIPLDEGFQIQAVEIAAGADSMTKVVFVCSPNNPTANIVEWERIRYLLENMNAIIIVDEAYIEFSERESLVKEVTNYPNLVVLRTFSKAWGLAGVRCGYCAASEEVIDLLFKIKAPYNISRLTAETILDALEDSARLTDNVKTIVKERDRIIGELKRMEGVKTVFKSEANFILFKVEDAEGVYARLADRGVIIRDRSKQPGLEGCLRATVGRKDENYKFLNLLKEVL